MLQQFDTRPASRAPRGGYGRSPVSALLIPDWARRLDLEADAELGMGHVEAAERLARMAAELRAAR